MDAVEYVMGLQKQRALIVMAAVFVAAIALFIVFRPGDQASAGVDLGDPNAWVEHGIDGELLQVNGLTGEVTARIEVAEPGQRFTAVPHGGGAVLFNETTSSISVVSGSLLRVVGTMPVGLADGTSPIGAQIFGSDDARRNVVVLTSEQLVSIDTQTNTESPISLPVPLSSTIQDSSGRLLALTDEADEVLRLDSDGLGLLAPLVEPVGGTGDQRSLVSAGGTTFVVDPARLSVSEILEDGTFGLPFCTTSAATGALTGGSGHDDEPVIVAYNPASATLNVSSSERGCSDVVLDLPDGDYGNPVVNHGAVYLPNWGTGRIIVISLDRAEVVANYPFGSRTGEAFELDVVGSQVWANEPSGPFAAVVSESGITAIPKISTVVAGDAEINEEGEGDSLVGANDIEGSGLVVIGDSGARVVAPQPGDSTGTGVGNGPESDAVDLLEPLDEPVEDINSDIVGISPAAVDAPAVPDPTAIDDDELVGQLTGSLIANFGVSSATAAEGEVVRFTDFSTGSPVSWTWDFGDGSGALEPNVEKKWDEQGIYLVSLTVTNSAGEQSIQTTEITIVPETVLIPPQADFVFDRNTIEVGESVTFESRTVGEADLLEWDFGDGDSSIGPEATHTYDTAGTFTVTLSASNPAGETVASTVVTVLVGVEPPTAAIASLPTSIVNGQFVTLRSASLNEPTRLIWDLGDGTRASGQSVQHQWANPGTYRVRLTAENSEGSDTAVADVVVGRRVDPPVSQFTQSATEVLVGERVTFTSLSLNNPTRLIWNFGDDTTANGQTTTKSWSRPGRYRVTLRATNDAGTNRTGVTVTVRAPVDAPVASFDASALVVEPGQRVSFQDTSSNSPTSWAWDFGDTGTSSNAATSHTWAKPGTYTVRLTVGNEGGTSTAQKQVLVKSPPSANFRWEADGTVVSFTDTSWDDPVTWMWDFGDGTTSTQRSPTHEFAPGVFDVTLLVSNEVGSSSKTQQVSFSPPTAVISCDADDAVLTCSGRGSKDATGFTWSSPEALSNTTPNQSTTSFTYPSAGRFDVTLTVSNEDGVTDSLTIKAPRVSRGRAPRVTSVSVAGTDGALVRLEANFDRNPTSWEWTVDGAELVEGGNTSTPLFRIPENGTYEGTVRASNAYGADTDPFSFTANPFTTTSSFTWALIEPGVVRFTNTSEAQDDAELEWRFNADVEILDGNPQSPVVRYPDEGGTWTTALVVSDGNGRDVSRQEITVPGVPEDPDDDE